jgi:hypothetical protein
MRDNGVTDFPDPDPNAGGFGVFGGGRRNLDPDNPTVQKAMDACQGKLPDLRRGRPSTGTTG